MSDATRNHDPAVSSELVEWLVNGDWGELAAVEVLDRAMVLAHKAADYGLRAPRENSATPDPDLRAAIEALAKEWEDEADRRERDAHTTRTSPTEVQALRLGARFERNHAKRLRSLSSRGEALRGGSIAGGSLHDPAAGRIVHDDNGNDGGGA